MFKILIMKKILFVCFLLSTLLGNEIQGRVLVNSNLPRVIILATGGTIAGSGESTVKAAYKAGQIPVDLLIDAVPEVKLIANVRGEQIANIGSQDMNVSTWLKLANRINDIFDKDEADAVVVTHGTDTQEETAYFLSLTVRTDNPVVLVGAMRPATALSQDGNRNLLDAVMVAASANSQGIGVVTAMNEEVYAARDVTKTSTTNTATFKSRNFGPIGLIYDSKVNYYYKSLRTPAEKFNISGLTNLPQVEIIYGYADASPILITNLSKQGIKGLVYAGMGNGNFNTSVGLALEEIALSGTVVCRAARAGSGRVTLDNEVDDRKMGFIVADDLNPQKARILLMLALTRTHDKKELQNIFFTY